MLSMKIQLFFYRWSIPNSCLVSLHKIPSPNFEVGDYSFPFSNPNSWGICTLFERGSVHGKRTMTAKRWQEKSITKIQSRSYFVDLYCCKHLSLATPGLSSRGGEKMLYNIAKVRGGWMRFSPKNHRSLWREFRILWFSGEMIELGCKWR